MRHAVAVGDSLTGQTVDALAHILGADLLDHKKLYYDKYSACRGALKFSWYRNDYLDTRTTASGGFETVHCELHDVSMSRCMVFGGEPARGHQPNHTPALCVVRDGLTEGSPPPRD